MTDIPLGEMEYRAAQQVGVSFPNRTIELIVMPYEQETVVPYQGRMVREVFTRGAFDGIERRANRIRVNRDHDAARTVGRAVALHPSRDEGLVAEIRIAQTDLGDETLALADEECLDASAGFLPMPGGETWEGRNLRRLTKAWLGHIAMTPDPAYEGARTLAVRTQTLTTAPTGTVAAKPNLDIVKGWTLEAEYQMTERQR
jgi:HK97 family phage prohead protease